MIDDSVTKVKGKDGLFDNVRGENCRTAKLTNEQVKEIKLNRGKFSQRFLAEIYNVSQVTICDIQKGRTWSHVKV